MIEGPKELTQPNPFKFMRTVDLAECCADGKGTADNEQLAFIMAELCKRVASLEQIAKNAGVSLQPL